MSRAVNRNKTRITKAGNSCTEPGCIALCLPRANLADCKTNTILPVEMAGHVILHTHRRKTARDQLGSFRQRRTSRETHFWL